MLVACLTIHNKIKNLSKIKYTQYFSVNKQQFNVENSLREFELVYQQGATKVAHFLKVDTGKKDMPCNARSQCSQFLARHSQER